MCQTRDFGGAWRTAKAQVKPWPKQPLVAASDVDIRSFVCGESAGANGVLRVAQDRDLRASVVLGRGGAWCEATSAEKQLEELRMRAGNGRRKSPAKLPMHLSQAGYEDV
eukprot:364505-Chlamydomonas_euryale.AAC.7